MKRLTSLGNGLKGLSKLSAGLMVAAAFGASACDEQQSTDDAGIDPELGVNFEALGKAITDCTAATTTANTGAFNATTKVLKISVDDGDDAVISVVNGKLKVNGNQCQTDGVLTPVVELTSTNVNKLEITADGTSKVVVDLLPGAFGNIFAGTGGIVVTGSSDNTKTLSVGVRGTAQANIVKMSEVPGVPTTSSPIYYMELSGDTRADLKIVPTLDVFPSISLALGAGADSFTAQGQNLTIATGFGVSAGQTNVGSTVISTERQSLTVFGGSENDTLKGGLGDDTLNGGDGNDLFQTIATTATVSQDGADTYIGGSNTDTIDYSGRTEAVKVSIGPASETAGWVKGVNIYNATIAANDDLTYTVAGGAPATLAITSSTTGATDILAALGGLVGASASVNDRGELIIKATTPGDSLAIAASEAGTTLFGGAKTNNGTTGLVVDADDGFAGENDDVRSDVENINGGTANDTLTGSPLPNLINGGAGDDNIAGGVGGTCTLAGSDTDSLNGGDGNDTFAMGVAANCSDILDGGAGTDMADYQMRAASVGVDLDGTADDGNGTATENDNVKATVEGVMGGAGDDSLTGGTAADDLHGGPGDDIINGGTGNDSLCGGLGEDVLNGGAGEDYFNEKDTVDPAYFAALANIAGDDGDVLNGGADTDKGDFARAAAMEVVLCSTTTLTGSPATACTGDTLNTDTVDGDDINNVEYFVGGANDDTITGSTGDDIIEGGGGNDTLIGGGGADALYGELGNDSLLGGAGDDNIDGAAGVNALIGGDGEGDICTPGGNVASTVAECEI